MPQGRKTADDRLAELERRLDALEAEQARSVERPKYTDEEIVEIALIQLAYVYEGDTERDAEHLVKDHGYSFREPELMARDLGRILEERCAVAPSRRYPA